MSHKIHYLIILCLLTAVFPVSAQIEAPELRVWFECVDRWPYEGKAIARVSYSYAGEFAVMADDSRWFGDDFNGESRAFTIEPGEHIGGIRVNVSAFKVATWKLIFGGKLYSVNLYDNPEILDCPLDELPLATPEATMESTGSV